MNRLVIALLLIVNTFCNFNLTAECDKKAEQRKKEEENALKWTEYFKDIYSLPENADFVEITDKLLASESVKEERKQDIIDYGRRIFVFRYPSDGLMIKGAISFVPHPEEHPTMVVLRGGNKMFSVVNPGSDLMNPKEYTVITTTYRDGLSEGTDEYGGNDVNDVKNLIAFFPKLEEALQVSIQKDNMFLLGFSRGGMEMFLTLSRYPELQSHFSKVVSLTGLLDIRQTIKARDDMKEMFVEEFGYQEGINDAEWLDYRDPILTADKIDTDLPILIIQGTEDIRITLAEGRHMVEQLLAHGNNLTYWEIEGGTHGLLEMPDRMSLILEWLES